MHYHHGIYRCVLAASPATITFTLIRRDSAKIKKTIIVLDVEFKFLTKMTD